MSGVQGTTLPPHLDKFRWREIHGQTPEAAFNNIIDHIVMVLPILPNLLFAFLRKSNLSDWQARHDSLMPV